jgi:hypothetical protein
MTSLHRRGAPRVFTALAALLAAASADFGKVTPVEKVITLLEDLEAEVKEEGTTEAGTYDQYACFCKTTTETKSDSIMNGQDTIDTLSAGIAEDTATVAGKKTELQAKKKEVEELTAELDSVVASCLKEAAEFEAEMADLTKACNSLDKALQAMQTAKGGGASLLQSNSTLREEVGSTLAIAEAMSLVEAPKRRAVLAFMQGRRVDPSSPEYKFHSDGIISVLEKLKTEFDDKKSETQSEMEKAAKLCTDSKTELTGQIDGAKTEITGLETDIDTLNTKISEDRASLIEAEDMLKDDKVYLKDLTAQCETSAREWDQRSQARGQELEVLAEALKIIRDGGEDGKKSVKDLETDAGLRSTGDSATTTEVNTRLRQRRVQLRVAPRPKQAVRRAPPSFLQQGSRSASLRSTSSSLQQAEEFLRNAGINLKSAALTAMAASLRKDPFAKVKTMIQNLIVRLLDEAKKEATKQGFCDTELGKAYKTRDFRLDDAKKLAAEIGLLRSKNDTLAEEIAELEEALPELKDTLNQTAQLRAQEKIENMDRIKVSKEGHAAVTEAIVLLKTYYKSKAKALLQTRASPVDEDTEGPGFSGSYRGKADGARGIIGLLEVIKSDFDRAARTTREEEDKAQREFVEFEQTSKEDIAGKEKSLELKQEDQAMTISSMEKGLEKLTTTQGLVDDAIKTVEDLKPMCLDMGQDYQTRVQKREEEIAALRQAITILTPAE